MAWILLCLEPNILFKSTLACCGIYGDTHNTRKNLSNAQCSVKVNIHKFNPLHISNLNVKGHFRLAVQSLHLSQKLKVARYWRSLRCGKWIKKWISYSSFWKCGLFCEMSAMGGTGICQYLLTYLTTSFYIINVGGIVKSYLLTFMPPCQWLKDCCTLMLQLEICLNLQPLRIYVGRIFAPDVCLSRLLASFYHPKNNRETPNAPLSRARL